MHRIDTPSAGPGSSFVGTNPVTGQEPTKLTPEFFQALQEEIAGFIESRGIPLNKADNSQLQQAVLSALSPGTGLRKSPLINAGFGINQRFPISVVPSYTVTSATGQPYYLDRWRLAIPSGAGSITATQTVHPLDVSGDVLPQHLGAPHYFLNFDCTTGFASERPGLAQRIESVRTFANRLVVASVYARLNAGSSGLRCRLVQSFGSGSGDADVELVGSSVTLTAAWARYEWAFTLGSLAGKTLGVAPPGDDYLELAFDFDQSSTFDADLSNPQLELGQSAGEWEVVPARVDLADCLRFYEKSTGADHAPSVSEDAPAVAGAYVPASGNVCYGANRPFRVIKRAVPTVTWYAGGGGGATPDRILWGGSSRTVVGVAAATASESATGAPDCSTAPASLDEYEANWTADAEL